MAKHTLNKLSARTVATEKRPAEQMSDAEPIALLRRFATEEQAAEDADESGVAR